MKTALFVFFAAFFYTNIHAQTLQKPLDASGLKADSAINHLLQPQSMQTPGAYFKMPGIGPVMTAIVQNKQLVYSRMPIAHLNSDDRMLIGKLIEQASAAAVKRVTVIDPLKTPAAVNP